MVLALGEVQTTVLMHSDSAAALADQVLALMPGKRVLISERPVHYAISPESFTGVDCRIPSLPGPQVRGVGTLVARAVLTGGRVVQGSVATSIERGAAGYRQPWSHYLARPGRVETFGDTNPDAVGRAHLAADRSASAMGMGALCGRLTAAAQRARCLDRRAPLTANRTALRWVLREGDESERSSARFTVGEDGLRTLWLTLRPGETVDVVALGEDLALHDWLLTALVSMVDRARIGIDPPTEVVARLRPAVDHLLHLWMPGARLTGAALAAWEEVDREANLSRQWDTLVRRVRDQIAMGAVLLHVPGARRPDAPVRGESPGW